MTDPWPDPLTKLLAIEQLRSLNARYCAALDARNVGAFVPLWDADAVYVLPGRGDFHGASGMTEAIGMMAHAWRQTLHLSGNLAVIFDGAGLASGTSDVVACCQNHDGAFTLLGGTYQDVYVLVGDAWLFRERRFTRKLLLPGLVTSVVSEQD